MRWAMAMAMVDIFHAQSPPLRSVAPTALTTQPTLAGEQSSGHRWRLMTQSPGEQRYTV